MVMVVVTAYRVAPYRWGSRLTITTVNQDMSGGWVENHYDPFFSKAKVCVRLQCQRDGGRQAELSSGLPNPSHTLTNPWLVSYNEMYHNILL